MRNTPDECQVGWDNIAQKLGQSIANNNSNKTILVIDCYQGTFEDEIIDELANNLAPDHTFKSGDCMLPQNEILATTQQDVTNDRIFGFLTRLQLEDIFDSNKLANCKQDIAKIDSGLIIITGIGASLLVDEPHILVYADMARWEIQLRMRRKEVNNIGINNFEESIEAKYKRGYFVDWRMCDRHKKRIMQNWDYVLDTNNHTEPKMLSGDIVREGLGKAARQPFSPVPYFDKGPWGGQWMKEVCDLDKNAENFAWCFNCVPEENSLLFSLGDIKFEIPSINVVFFDPVALLGEAVYGRFGDEFPIRFDFLDTMDGGNLSLQVHPLTEYIQEKFGIHYTQDESYYLLDAKDDAVVYLGVKEGIDSNSMISDLQHSEKTGAKFADDQYINKWPAKKHDHFLIPAGTIHCSGRNSMVLEISATPYIFTFKLWDWGRLGLDGKPRPINIEHGKNVIRWERDTKWTEENLINRITTIDSGEGWSCERTGLHEREFIETDRYWFTGKVNVKKQSGVQVINVIEGREVIVESPSSAFEPKVFHYAETFIVPAYIGEFTVSPHGESIGNKCGIITAYVRT